MSTTRAKAANHDTAAVAALYEAAQAGDIVGQFSYGVALHFGYGVKEDKAAAVFWYRKAAEQGDATAQHGLGLMYAIGQGVPQNYTAAYLLSNLAAAGGDKPATEFRNALLKHMTPAQIEVGQALVRQWKPGNPLPLDRRFTR